MINNVCSINEIFPRNVSGGRLAMLTRPLVTQKALGPDGDLPLHFLYQALSSHGASGISLQSRENGNWLWRQGVESAAGTRLEAHLVVNRAQRGRLGVLWSMGCFLENVQECLLGCFGAELCYLTARPEG